MSTFRIPFDRVNWTTSSFLIGTALIAITCVPVYLWNFGIDRFQAAMFLFYVTATAMSITLGYHRLFSHLAFKAKWPVRLATLVFGACAFENSCIDWASDHRKHHKHVDHDDDPYDISKGFFWAHMGWLMFKLRPEPPIDNVNDLRKDRLVMWQHRWVHLIAIAAGIVVPSLLGGLHGGWQGALGGFLLSGIARIVVVQHSTFFINSLCHTVGKQPYSTKHSARDSMIMAFLTFGEGYHNYHHEFQHDYRNGVKPWQWDPTKWSIWLLSKIGLAENLRRVPDSKILLAEMTEARRRAEWQIRQLLAAGPTIPERALEHIHELAERLGHNYQELKTAVANQVEVSRHVLIRWQSETRQLVRQLSRLPTTA